VLCADNRRCRDTVKALFPADFAVVPTPLLFNVHIPEWVGLSEEAAETQYSALYNQWYNDPDGVIFSNGDSLHKLRDRLQRLFASVDEACAVVTHTTPFQLLVCDALGLELAGVWRFKPEFYSFAVIGPQIVWGLNASSLQAITLRL
jgi:broad specificity phosphatase PhoE